MNDQNPAPAPSDAYTRLAEQLTPEQKQLLVEIDAEVNTYWVAESQAIAVELVRHLASPAIVHQLLYQHVIDTLLVMRGVCCTREDQSPRYV
jgi:hypothetical protein